MKLTINEQLRSLNGEAMFEMDKDVRTPIDLKLVCVNAILRPHASDEQVSGIEKMKRLDLATKIYKAEESIEVTAEEIVTLKMLIARSYGTMIAGRALQMLENIK